ncbi:MAG: double-cubane-cluster-containing anaerobic reductase [Planctomycetota bacterium]
MSDCDGGSGKRKPAGGDCASASPCASSSQSQSGAGADDDCPLTHFGRMIQNCYEHATAAKENGSPVVGIMCEFTPREIIMAAGAVPICLCGGSEATIPAAERELPANLCPLIKSTYGYHVEKKNPFLEMADMVVAETTCDGKKKMYELMARSRPMYVLELTQKPDDEGAFEHWLGELGKLKEELERRFGVEVTDARLREAISTMNRERALRRSLAELMKADAPPLTGRELIALKSSISGLAADFAQYEKALEMLPGRSPFGALDRPVRVLMSGVPMAHGAERVLDIVEGSGGLVVAMENCTGLKPIIDDVDENADDPLRAIAEKYYHLPCSVMTPNDRRLELIATLAKEYRAEAVVDLVWQACITYDVETARVKRLAEEELGLPYLRIETDYSPSDSARIAVRVEALFETVRAAGAAADG